MLATSVPNLHTDPTLNKLLQGTNDNHNMSLYLSLVLTDVGHRLVVFFESIIYICFYNLTNVITIV